jgi:hypothetical protein
MGRRRTRRSAPGGSGQQAIAIDEGAGQHYALDAFPIGDLETRIRAEHEEIRVVAEPDLSDVPAIVAALPNGERDPGASAPAVGAIL